MIHLENDKGRAKCGTFHSKWKFDFVLTKDKGEVTCNKCLNKRSSQSIVLPIDKDYIGKVFTYSFGYDMTINIYAKVIKQTAKSLVAQECYRIIKDDDGRGSGTSVAGDIKPNGEIYRLQRKEYISNHSNYKYWTGGGQNWSLDDGKPKYYNTWD